VIPVGGSAEVRAVEGVVQAATAAVAPFQEADEKNSESHNHSHDHRRAGVDDGGRGQAGDPGQGGGTEGEEGELGEGAHRVSGFLNLWLDRPALPVRSPMTMPLQRQ
jgi:hypothetical protein